MNPLFRIIAVSFATVATGLAALDTAKIDNLTGLKGKMNEKEGVYKFTFPRNDVKVAVDGWTDAAVHGPRHRGRRSPQGKKPRQW